jgi:hypothetical protein
LLIAFDLTNDVALSFELARFADDFGYVVVQLDRINKVSGPSVFAAHPALEEEAMAMILLMRNYNLNIYNLIQDETTESYLVSA